MLKAGNLPDPTQLETKAPDTAISLKIIPAAAATGTSTKQVIKQGYDTNTGAITYTAPKSMYDANFWIIIAVSTIVIIGLAVWLFKK